MNVLAVRSCREPKGLEAPEMWRTQRGFTLLEMMVVIAIIGLIAALVVPQIMGHMDKARAKTTKLQIRELENAVDLFKLENGFYPARLEDLVVRPANVKTWPPSGYMKELPVDAWDNAFVYLMPGTRGPYDITSYGADARPGGEDENADITN
jgi:general secretion pathway protein G